MTGTTDYDRRLFSGGLRKRIHEGRFRWLRRETVGMSGTVIEIGCFNGRSLEYLSFSPDIYLGLDAGWEGGLAEAIEKYPQYDFKESIDPADLDGLWDIALALETLEHIPRPGMLNQYIERLARHSKVLIATVPMEIGPLFAAKFLYKKFIHGYKANHTLPEFFYQTFGLCDHVAQDNHQGFDYRALIQALKKHFLIEKVEGINSALPKLLNTQICIRARSKYIKPSLGMASARPSTVV